MDSMDSMDNVDNEGKQPATPEAQHLPGGDYIFEQLCSVNEATFAEGDYETACDVLQAALARARYLRDAAHITAVERQAAKQYNLLRQQVPDVSQAPLPDVHHARQEAILRVYASIIQQAPGLAQLVRLPS